MGEKINKYSSDINSKIFIITDQLIRLNYKKLQFFPMNQIKKHPGRELMILRSFLLENRITIFKGSFFQKIYERKLKKNHLNLYLMYKFFIKGERLSNVTLLEFFDEEEIDELVLSGIISYKDYQCISNYRIIPLDNMLIVCSLDSDVDKPDYVYIGEDSIVFYNLLQNEIKVKVRNALEIGCGSGFLSLWMTKFAQKVTAVDINQNALELADLNAGINGIDNLITCSSDVYTNIQGQYDLIISNPPYVFLPQECSDRTYAFGGNLGLKILEKIFLGLDEFLSVDGTCYLIFFSYIKYDSENTALELIKEVFRGKPYSITLEQIDYHPLKNYPSFYEENGISHAVRYFMKIQKTPSSKLTHIQIQGVKKIIEKIKIRF